MTLRKLSFWAVLAFAACRETSVDYRGEGGGAGTDDTGGSGNDAGAPGDDGAGRTGSSESGGASAANGGVPSVGIGGTPATGVGGAGSAAGGGGQDTGGDGGDDGAGGGGQDTGGGGLDGGAGGGSGEAGRPGRCTDDATLTPECVSNPIGVFPAMPVPAAVGVAVVTLDGSGGIFSAFASKANSPMMAVTWAHEGGTVPWTGWRCFDAVPYPRRVAAISLLNAQPEVFATSDCGELYVRRLIAGIGWTGWSRFNLPSASSFVTDIALALSEEGVNLVYVADRGSVFARHRVGSDTYAPFGTWQDLGASDARVVSAGRLQGGRQLVVLLDGDGHPHGQVQRSADVGAQFEPPVDFDSAGVPELIDIEAVAETEPLEVLAVDRSGALWLRRENGSGAFAPWEAWPGPKPPERLSAIGAAGLRNAEGFPVVAFAVGQSGTTYHTRRAHDIWDAWQVHY